MAGRKCIVTQNTQGANSHLLRLVADGKGGIVPDLKCNLPGKAVWITRQENIVAKAVREKLFSKLFVNNGEAENETEQLTKKIDKVLQNSALAACNLARKAGQCIMGAEKIKIHLAKGNIIALLFAIDGSKSQYEKLFLAARSVGLEKSLWQFFTVEQQSKNFGGDNIVQIALLSGKAGGYAKEQLANLAFYRQGKEGGRL